ncbi:MAG: EamA family transporter [Bacteroidetes bacterium]|nr:EamA family transporter [Bacteroidota bacterium]
MSHPLYGIQAPWKVLVALGLVYFIWGSTYLGIAVAIQSMPPMLMLGARFGVAGLLLYAWVAARGRARMTRVQWKNASIAGTLLLGVGTGALAWAEQFIPSGLAAVLVTVSPIWMVTLDWLWKSGPKPNAFTVTGIILGLAGIVVLFDPASVLTGTGINVTAAVILIAGTVGWGIGSLFGRHADLPTDPFLSTAVQMGMGGVALLVAGLFMGEVTDLRLAGITLASFAAWAYLVVFGSIVAFTAYVWLMRHAAPSLVSTHAFVNPVVAVMLGWIVLNETLSGRLFVATALLVAGLVFIGRSGQRRGPRKKVSGPESLPPAPSMPGQSRGALRPGFHRRFVQSIGNRRVA